ncbi:MAG TPA: hypothetical protein PLL71_12205 [Agriterribacter sp.]|nr:hypothetical protein [Agriterribacter sp.]
MKKSFIIIAFGLSAILCLHNPAQAQENVFITLEYMHVKPENRNAYLQIENSWRKIHQARQKKGNIVGWSVWEVVAPYKIDAPYQYVVLTVYPHFSNLLHAFDSIDIHQVFPGVSEDSLNKMFGETGNVRDLVRRDIFSPDDHVGNVNGNDINYSMVTYLSVSPEKEQSFKDFMTKHRKPVSEKIVKNGFADFWWHGGLMFGEGANSSYNHIVVYQWKYDQMFDKLPPFDQYKKEDPASGEGFKWFTEGRTELIHIVLSLGTGLK